MQQATMESSKSRRKLGSHWQFDSLRFLIGDQFMKDVQGWLSPADSWKNYHVACELRHRGTSEWFIQGTTFSEWKSNSGSLLWVCGKRPLLPSLMLSQRLIVFFLTSGRWKGNFLVCLNFQ